MAEDYTLRFTPQAWYRCILTDHPSSALSKQRLVGLVAYQLHTEDPESTSLEFVYAPTAVNGASPAPGVPLRLEIVRTAGGCAFPWRASRESPSPVNLHERAP